MDLQEKIYIDSLKTNALPLLGSSPYVYISRSFSQAFITATTASLGGGHITVDDTIPHGKSFDLIIVKNQQEPSITMIASYRSRLKNNGLLAFGTYNTHHLQSGNNIRNGYRLNNTSDMELSAHFLHPIYREALGKFTRINRLSTTHVLNKILYRFGRYLPNSTYYSPFIFIIYQLASTVRYTPYVSRTSFSQRLSRVLSRLVYKIQNHKINDYIIATKRQYIIMTRLLKSALFIHRYNFHTKILPTIPKHKLIKNKQTLIIVMTYLQIGGVERVMLNIIKGLDRHKFTIHLLTTSPSDNSWHDKFQEHVDYIVHIPDEFDEHWPEKYREHYIEEYVINNETDVIFITNSHAAYYALPTIYKRRPTIRTYDLLHTHGTPQDNDAYLRISMPFDKYINKRIVIDEYLKEYYLRRYPVSAEKVYVIYNSIDLDDPRNKTNVTTTPFIDSFPDNRKMVTFIGRLEVDKSPIRLVDIAIELRARNIPASIVVIGDGTLFPIMKKRATEAAILDDYIYFCGALNNPLPIAKQSDFTILVSNAEGISMSVLESMSVATPVIASAVGGIPEIIDNNIDGYLVDILSHQDEQQKINAFVDAIATATSISSKEYQKMQTESVSKVDTRFSHTAQIYEHLFETGEIVNTPSPRKK